MNPLLQEVENYINSLHTEIEILKSSSNTLMIEMARLYKLTDIYISATKYMRQNIPYKFGKELGNDGAFDCSSFMQQIFSNHGVKLPRTSLSQSKVGVDVTNDVQFGDLLFFDTNKDGVINHEGFAINENEMIHTAKEGENIVISNFRQRYGAGFICARRVTV